MKQIRQPHGADSAPAGAGRSGVLAADRLGRFLFYVVFFAVFALLLRKCRYGFADRDEAFYLTIPYRLARGDRMLIHEWHLTQFASFTMIPEMWVYLRIAKTTEGIFLAFRYIYTVLWCAGALFLYARTRRINEWGARCASLFLMGYAPFGIMAFSYNSLGILYLVNSAVFLLCAVRHQKIQFALSGVFFAAAVLCCPFLAAVYLMYTLLLGVLRFRKKNPVIPLNRTDVTTCWKYFTLGIILLAVLFLAALFSGGTPGRLLSALECALRDPEHNAFSLSWKTGHYFRRIANSNALFWPMLVTLALMIALARRRRRFAWLCIACAAAAGYLARFAWEYLYINFLMIPATFLGLYVLAVTADRRIRWLAGMWLIPGILYTYCLNYSSNQFFYAISSAATVSSVAGILMTGMHCGELINTCDSGRKGSGLYRAAVCVAVLACFGVQLGFECFARYEGVFWEPGLMESKEQTLLEEGPEKGLITTADHAEAYRMLYKDVKGIDHERTLFLTKQVWVYLVNENENASYSGWLWKVNRQVIERLNRYYALCPEKRPGLIFLDGEKKNLLGSFDPGYFEIGQTESGNFLIRLRPGQSWPGSL